MPLPSASRAALVIAHPGHELRVHGWLEQARPLVFVLTDGSGGAGQPRLDSTVRVLERAGAEAAAVFGRFTDRELYAAILAGDYSTFTALVGELADGFVRAGVRFVAGDATDRYNPGHDACRLLTDAAVAIARAATGQPIANFAFPLTGLPDSPPPDCRAEPLGLALDDEAFARKCAAAEGYPELRAEVAAAFAQVGPDAFRREQLYPVDRPAGTVPPAEVPHYEQYGGEQVRAGRYRELLRYETHFAPLCRAVWEYARGRRWRACAS